MTVEELVHRFDDLVAALERIADHADDRAQELAAVEVERFAALLLDELLGPMPDSVKAYDLRRAVGDALDRFEKDEGR